MSNFESAISSNNGRVILSLYNNGIMNEYNDDTDYNPIYEASLYCDNDIFSLLCSIDHIDLCRDAIYRSITNNEYNIFNRIINQLGEYIKYIPSILINAVQHESIEMVKLLLEKGLHPDITDNMGSSAFMLSCGDIPLMKLCLEYGAYINHTNNLGRSAIFWAQDKKTVDFLLSNGATLDIVDIYNKYPYYQLNLIDSFEYIKINY